VEKASGKTIWKADRPQAVSWNSPIVDTAGKDPRVFIFFCKSGSTTVVAAGPQLNVLARNQLKTEDRVYAVAAAGGAIVLRTGRQLTCIRNANRVDEQIEGNDSP